MSLKSMTNIEIKDLAKRLRALMIIDEVGSNNPMCRDAADLLDELLDLRATIAANGITHITKASND